ncbi:MAG: non-canonical purine NTP pyrophosphatase [Phycisphaerales bacterium]
MPIGDEPIVIATGNPHKVEEIRAILGKIGVGVVGLSDLAGEFAEPVEGRASFEANATLKALSYAEQTGRVCLADDSGLEVDALGGAPGVISSHYATDGEETGISREARDAANNAKLLKDLEGVAPEQRSARFVCTMVLATPSPPPGDAPPSSGTIPPEGTAPPGGVGFQPTRKNSVPQFNDGAFQTRRGDLPHWQLAGATYFVTWRTHAGVLSPEERRIVADACSHWDGTRIVLHAATVMPDHVHMLFRIKQQEDGSWPDLAGLMHSIKRHSAAQIQKKRGEAGALWQREYFDRIVRDADEAEEKFRYIEKNAVKAGLCERPGEYPFLIRNAGRLETGPTGGRDSRILAVVRGAFEGRIGMPHDVPRGANGFGYDPLVLVGPDYTRTSAELSAEEKNARSHRGEAARLMAREIGRLRGLE